MGFRAKNIPDGKENFVFKELNEGGTLKRLSMSDIATKKLFTTLQF